jgi:hypothetical protein
MGCVGKGALLAWACPHGAPGQEIMQQAAGYHRILEIPQVVLLVSLESLPLDELMINGV